jgi:hypothetical protein
MYVLFVAKSLQGFSATSKPPPFLGKVSHETEELLNKSGRKYWLGPGEYSEDMHQNYE